MRNLAILTLSLVATTAAGDIVLQQPVACTLGDDCYIQQTMDHDPSNGARDAFCENMTYDTHKGTDFGLASLAAMADGVNVIAAANGVVQGIRDGMVDIAQRGPNAPDIKGRECGNGVVINHADGFVSQYCHLKNSSVLVTANQQVIAGQALGEIGLSGKTEFPHLHFALRKDGKPVDPFDLNDPATCNDPVDSAWLDIPNPPQGGLIAIGISDFVPSYNDVKAGDLENEVAANGEALIAWAYVFHGHKGDVIASKITGKTGAIVDQSTTLEKDQAQLYRAMGRRTPATGWPKGAYVLEVTLSREGAIMAKRNTTFTID